MLKIILLVLYCLGCAHSINLSVPILYMKLVDFPSNDHWTSGNPPAQQLQTANKVAAIHWAQLNSDWTIERVYGATVNSISNNVYTQYISVQSPLPVSNLSDINYNWTFQVPEQDIRGTPLNNKHQAKYYTFGTLQELMLVNISQQMSIDLSRVASRLGVPERNLSYSYDPARWEDVVHAMVEESILVYLNRLELRSVDSIAILLRFTTTQLRNTAIPTYLSLLPPLYSKKTLLDKNTTGEMLASLGISGNPNNVIIMDLVNKTTGLTAEDFGILYNITKEQYLAMSKATLLQMSETCGLPMSQLLEMTLPNISWNVAGSMFKAAPCLVIVREKGAAINALGVANPQSNTALQLLLIATGQKWRKARLTESFALSEWDLLDSITVQGLSQAASVNLQSLLNGSVSDLIARLNAIDLNNQKMNSRQSTLNALQTIFNVTSLDVSTLTGLPSMNIQLSTSPKLVEIFINATTSYFNIPLSSIYGKSQMTSQELFNLPTIELTDIISNIINTVVKLQAGIVNVSEANAFTLMNLFSHNDTIAELKVGIQIVNAILAKKNKFENQTVGAYLTSATVSDITFLEMTIFSVLLSASGFTVKELNIVYGLTDSQISVLQKVKVKDMSTYCRLDPSSLKQRTTYNITGNLIGIKNVSATCKATSFYVAAKGLTLDAAKRVCGALTNSSASLMRLTEHCSGLSWRYSVKIFDLGMENWSAADLLTIGNLPSHSDLTVSTIQETSFQNVLKKSVESNPSGIPSLIASYRNPLLSELFRIFSTSKIEISQVLGITVSSIDGLPLVGVVEVVQNFLKTKYTVDLRSVASAVGVSLDNLKYLAPTEWHEMLTALKQEISVSGSSILNVTQDNFAQLLSLTSTSELSLQQLAGLWDENFLRVFKGKRYADGKVINEIMALLSISQDRLNRTTLIQFFEKYLNLTKMEMSVLFRIDGLAIDVLRDYTFKEMPSSCGLAQTQVNGKTPFALVTAMIGHGDITSCRNVALITALREGTIDSMMTKFSITVNSTVSVLIFLENTIDLQWPKIAWGLNISVSDWPILGAVSISDFANITSTAIPAVTNSSSFTQMTMELRLNIRAEYRNNYHMEVVKLASILFAVNSSKACGNCTLPGLLTTDVLKTFLSSLGETIFFDLYYFSSVLGYTNYKFMMLLPSQWPRIVPHIVPTSFSNASSLLGLSQEQLAGMIGVSKITVLNQTLREYVQLITHRLSPLVECRISMSSVSLLAFVSSRGIYLASLTSKNVLQILNTLCPSVSQANVSLIMSWGSDNITVLGTYTLQDAATCKGVTVSSIASRTLDILATLMLNEVHDCSSPTPTPCTQGTVRKNSSQNCTDVNECSRNDTCQSGQFCQNFHGGYQCECETPGYKVVNEQCDKILKFVLTFTIINLQYSYKFAIKSTPEYYEMKVYIEKETGPPAKDRRHVDSDLNRSVLAGISKDGIWNKAEFNLMYRVFQKPSTLRVYYRGSVLSELRSGSVIVEVFVLMSPQFTGTIPDITRAFLGGTLNSTNNQNYLGRFRIQSPSSTDYDECNANVHDCHQDATCVNKQGMFSCECKRGFEGDGRSCKLQSTTLLLAIIFLVLASVVSFVVIIFSVCLFRVLQRKISPIEQREATQRLEAPTEEIPPPRLSEPPPRTQEYMELRPRPGIRADAGIDGAAYEPLRHKPLNDGVNLGYCSNDITVDRGTSEDYEEINSKSA